MHEYLRFCESVVIEVLRGLGLKAGRFGPTGVWIEENSGTVKKIASLGVAVRRWVTFHGLALNVNNSLRDFDGIRPCNFESSVMTSLKEQGIFLSMQEAAELLKCEVDAQLAGGAEAAERARGELVSFKSLANF